MYREEQWEEWAGDTQPAPLALPGVEKRYRCRGIMRLSGGEDYAVGFGLCVPVLLHTSRMQKRFHTSTAELLQEQVVSDGQKSSWVLTKAECRNFSSLISKFQGSHSFSLDSRVSRSCVSPSLCFLCQENQNSSSLQQSQHRDYRSQAKPYKTHSTICSSHDDI